MRSTASSNADQMRTVPDRQHTRRALPVKNDSPWLGRLQIHILAGRWWGGGKGGARRRWKVYVKERRTPQARRGAGMWCFSSFCTGLLLKHSIQFNFFQFVAARARHHVRTYARAHRSKTVLFELGDGAYTLRSSSRANGGA